MIPTTDYLLEYGKELNKVVINYCESRDGCGSNCCKLANGSDEGCLWCLYANELSLDTRKMYSDELGIYHLADLVRIISPEYLEGKTAPLDIPSQDVFMEIF